MLNIAITTIEGVLPGLIESLFQFLLPFLMRFISRWSGAFSRGQLDKDVICQLYIFQLVCRTLTRRFS